MYHYWGFGLTIKSEIEFPELLPVSIKTADVKICIAKTPSAIEGIRCTTTNFSHFFNSSEFIFEVAGIARYYATNGNQIDIEPIDTSRIGSGKQMREIRLYVLATVFAAILLQRNLLPLHASAIIKDNKLNFITGDSGVGKSTTLAGLLKKGHTIFSDDVVVLKKEEEANVTAQASYPMIKLWDDTLEKLEHEMFNDRSFTVKAGMNKYGIFFHGSFDTKSYPARNILILKKQDIPKILVQRLTGPKAFNELTKQVYRPILVHTTQLRALTFNIATALANDCAVYEITRPVNCHPEELLENVEALMI